MRSILLTIAIATLTACTSSPSTTSLQADDLIQKLRAENDARGRLNADRGRCKNEADRAAPTLATVEWVRVYDQCLIAAGHRDEVTKSKQSVQDYLDSPASKAHVQALKQNAHEAARAVQAGGSSWVVNGKLCYSRPTPTGTWIVNCQ
jgi:hypothetical protein